MQGRENLPPLMLGRSTRGHPKLDPRLESLHLTHAGIWGMITLAQYAFLPYMHQEILNKAARCKPCTEMGKNFKPIFLQSKWQPLVNCSEPNEETQIDFAEPVTSKKRSRCTFLSCIQRFSKYPTLEVFEKHAPNVVKFLDDYIQIHGVPRNIRLDQARCLIGNKVKNFCKQNNINIITAPTNDHRVIRLVERLIQTIKRPLKCMILAEKKEHSQLKTQ